MWRHDQINVIKDRPVLAADHELPGVVQYGDSFNLCSDDALYRLLVLSSILPHYTVTKNSNSKWIVAKTSNMLFFHSIICITITMAQLCALFPANQVASRALLAVILAKKIIDNRINEIVHLLHYL